jgi:lysophospholipase L1-like esterase
MINCRSWLCVCVLAVLETVQAARYLGRVNPATKELTWSGTGVSFTFDGTSASVGIEAVSGTNSAELVIDGKSTFIPNVQGLSISTPSLPDGNHTISFLKSSEALFGTITIGNITTDGALGPNPPLLSRKIEIIGDSITSAYGIGAPLPCTNTAALEIISDSYSVLVANALNADYSIISWSGIGIIRNFASGGTDTSPIMPERYTKYGANDASGSYTFPASDAPDAVVINLGTNDFGHSDGRPLLSGAEYAAAMIKFIRFIQTSYKNDPSFFLLTSPMLGDGYPAGEMQKSTQTNALRDVVKEIGAKAHVVDWPTQGQDVGCDYHPTPATQKIGADVLVESMRGALGW